MFKVNNKNSRSGIFIINFEHKTPCSSVSIVNFEHVIAGWVNEVLGVPLKTGWK